MNAILACTSCTEDWRQFHPTRHWKAGYSARLLAERWQSADGFPAEVATALSSSDQELSGLTPMMAVPEYRVPLPGGDRASHNDLLVLGRGSSGGFAMVVEGKVRESFGPTLKEWKRNSSPGKKARWQFLCRTLGLPVAQGPDLRYQLYHRTASAILAAEAHHATTALVLIHSFGAPAESFDDYKRFCSLFGAAPAAGGFSRLRLGHGPKLYAGWVVAR